MVEVGHPLHELQTVVSTLYAFAPLDAEYSLPLDDQHLLEGLSDGTMHQLETVFLRGHGILPSLDRLVLEGIGDIQVLGVHTP